MLNFILQKIFGSKNDRELKRMAPFVDRITSLEPEYAGFPTPSLPAKTPNSKSAWTGAKPLTTFCPRPLP